MCIDMYTLNHSSLELNISQLSHDSRNVSGPTLYAERHFDTQ